MSNNDLLWWRGLRSKSPVRCGFQHKRQDAKRLKLASFVAWVKTLLTLRYFRYLSGDRFRA